MPFDRVAEIVEATNALRPDLILMLGRDRTPDGEPVPGARIQHEYNLVQRGLAWQRGITSSKEFMALLAEIREAFPRL